MRENNSSLADKNVKAKLLQLKGKTLDLLDEYSKDAEDALSKSVQHYIS